MARKAQPERPLAPRRPGGKRRPYAARLPAAERREQLLDATLAVISRDGYGAVSIEAIAKQAGVTRPVVYGIFDGLDPLLLALLDRQEERALTQLLQALPQGLPGGDPSDIERALEESVRRLVEMVRNDPETWRLILTPPEHTPDAVRRRIDRDRETARTRIESLLDASGRISDPELTAHVLIGMAEYFGRVLVEDPESLDADRLGALVSSLIRTLGTGR
jgi:AcrR family transcriptional regulator